MFNFLTRLFKPRKFPKYIKNVWWNGAAYIKDCKFPVIFDENEKYIHCEEGMEVAMFENDLTYRGHPVAERAMYKVTKVWRDRPWSDWLHSSDSIHCNMEFSHVEKIKTI
jgi:hypothetical protein